MKYDNSNCPIYKKHHNIIDGVYMVRLPYTWEEIDEIDEIDSIDEDGELYSLISDIKIYDIEEIENFKLPTDDPCISETIFIIRRDGEYYLCETQGEPIIKFSTNISKLNMIKSIDRIDKIKKVQENTNQNNL